MQLNFRHIKTSKLLTNKAKVCKYQTRDSEAKKQEQILAPLELKEDDFLKISKYCKKKKIEFTLTVP